METQQGRNFVYHTVKKEKFLPVAFQVCSQICPALLPAKAWVPKTLGKFETSLAVGVRILMAHTVPGSWGSHTQQHWDLEASAG